MITMVSQITSLTIVYSTVYSGADQRKHQSSASLAFVWGIHRWPHKGPVTRKMFPFDDAIMKIHFKHGTRYYCYCYKFPGIAARCLICQFTDGLRSAPPRNMHMFVLCCILSLFDYALAYILHCYIAVIIMLFLCYDVILENNPGLWSQRRRCFTGIGIPIIRFILGIAISKRRHHLCV